MIRITFPQLARRRLAGRVQDRKSNWRPSTCPTMVQHPEFGMSQTCGRHRAAMWISARARRRRTSSATLQKESKGTPRQGVKLCSSMMPVYTSKPSMTRPITNDGSSSIEDYVCQTTRTRLELQAPAAEHLARMIDLGLVLHVWMMSGWLGSLGE